MIWSRSLHATIFTPNLTLPVWHVDFETRSANDLRKSGVYRYAEDATTDAWCMSHGVQPEGVRTWRPGQAFPPDLLAHVLAGGRIGAHNAQFERVIWNVVLCRRYGLPIPELQPEQMVCTMAKVMARALPGGLADAAAVLKLDVVKDTEGAVLMKKMAKPRRPKKGDPTDRLLWHDAPEQVDRLCLYCEQDVRAEIAIDEAVDDLTPDELALWCLDQRINDRGIQVDVTAAGRAYTLIEQVKANLDGQMRAVTDARVDGCSKLVDLGGFLTDLGLDVTGGLAKGKADTLSTEAKEAGLDAAVEALGLRKDYAKSSTGKVNAILASACQDGRSRGLFQWHGAATGRWAGRLIQPHNMPRTKKTPDPDAVLAFLRSTGISDSVLLPMATMLFGYPMAAISNTLRAMLKARDGYTFVQRDFSNVEGRANAWISDELWKLDAFRDYDTIVGTDAKGKPIRLGPDLYRLAYARAFGIRVEDVDDDLRQLGKVMELALGYQGGVGAFQNMAKVYGVTVPDEEADRLKRAWREANPAITASWWEYQDGVVEATATPGRVVSMRGGRVLLLHRDGFLFLKLPSGRLLSYYNAHIVWENDMRGRARRAVHYEGYKPLKGGTGRIWSPDNNLYGGVICNNIVQALSRDLLVHVMRECEARGWAISAHVHDEVVLEVPIDAVPDPAEVDAVCTSLPAWMDKGLAVMPMAVGGWTGARYRKD